MNNSVLYPKGQTVIEPNPLREDLLQKQIPGLCFFLGKTRYLHDPPACWYASVL